MGNIDRLAWLKDGEVLVFTVGGDVVNADILDLNQ
jgi:hypothetical protein